MTRPTSERVLGLDPGQVRIGVAISDPLGITAQPLELLKRQGRRRDFERIGELVREHGVGCVVVGHPLSMSGEAGPKAREAETFAERLRQALPAVRVELWDERLTTAEAERTMIAADVRRKRRRQRVDSLAAVLILQGWLDARTRPVAT